MIITFICSDRLEDQIRMQLRFRNIADAINRTGVHLAYLIDLGSFIQNSPKAQKICDRSDILVIYRYVYGPMLTTIQYWKAREKKIVVDFDQAIDYLTPDMPEYSFWLEGMPFCTPNGNSLSETRIDPIPLEQFKWGLGVADGATTVSTRLARDWSQYTHIYEIPDFLNTCHYPGLDAAQKDEIWLGLGHNVNYPCFKKSGLSVAMEHVCRKYPQVRLILLNPGNGTDVDVDIDTDQIRTYSSLSYEEWVGLLLKFDIGLVPVYSDFDLRLGSVNLLEFMIAKIPWIATAQQSSQDLSRYGQWVSNSPEAWECAIIKVVEQLDKYRKKAAGEPFLYALGQDASAHIDRVLLIYSAILNQ